MPNHHLCSREAHGSTARSAPIETTELRWFRNGPLPRLVCSWFTSNGACDAVEERHDRYLMDGRLDRGRKLRGGSTLELKVRQTIARTVPSSDGPDAVATLPRGTVEEWQKWSPADHLVSIGSEPWVAVHQRIVKRRLTIAGEEMTVLDHADTPVGAYATSRSSCSTMDQPRLGPLPSLHTGRSPVDSPASVPPGERSSPWHDPRPDRWCSTSRGYPEWLVRRIGDISAVTGR